MSTCSIELTQSHLHFTSINDKNKKRLKINKTFSISGLVYE